jgi:molybdopterin synthase catalytic subunit
MSIAVTIFDGPLPAVAPWSAQGAGAVIVFEGVVRPDEQGQIIAGLSYEVYEPMASTQLRDLAQRLVCDCGLLGLIVRHSRGFVPVGQISFRLQVAALHRKEALRAVDEFIDCVKRDVPIWKTAVFAGDRPHGGERHDCLGIQKNG